MKTALLFLLIAFSTISLSAAYASPDPVLDATGKILRSGIDYHVLPVFKGKGGGLTLANTGKEPCPLDVVQEKYEFKDGLPLTFTPVNPKKGVIRVSTDLNIKFSVARKCPQSTTYCKVTCRDVDIFIKNGMLHLALSDVPFKVMFKKA
ncbi:hypothetical protein LguiA_007201 [Lonicera macranthoides]